MLLPAMLVLLVTPSNRQTVSGTVVVDCYETLAQKTAGKPYFSEPLRGAIVTGDDALAAGDPAAGAFALAVPPGKHLLRVLVPSWALDDLQIPVEVTGEKPVRVDIHVPLVVPDGPGIRGRVFVYETGYSPEARLGSGRPGLGALVRVLSEAGAQLSVASVDDDGSFYLRVPGIGNYSIEATVGAVKERVAVVVARNKAQQIGYLNLKVPPPPHSFQTGIDGDVLVWTPSPPPTKAFSLEPTQQARIEIVDPRTGAVVATTLTDQRGAFAVATPSGDLLVRVQGIDSLPTGRATVKHGEVVRIPIRSKR